MTPTPNKHRRVRECLGEWRKRCILHSIFGGNTRALRTVKVAKHVLGHVGLADVDVVKGAAKAGLRSTRGSVVRTGNGSEDRLA